ncbi:hypothetical protein [Psychrobacter maritimus]|uniref:hypothetical protein n=1 Tax=Psychrobacter maritimus TaxID=256325 RepID=UPI0039B09337
MQIKPSSLVCAKRDKQSTVLSYIAFKREGHAAIALTKLTLRQQLSKNNDARIRVTHADIVKNATTVTHANNDALSDSDNINASIVWHHDWSNFDDDNRMLKMKYLFIAPILCIK